MNIVVAQSGGPTAAINASLLGVYRGAKAWPEVDTVYGSLNGIEGIMKDNLVALELDETEQSLLRQTPSAALHSCRYKLPTADKDPAVYETIRRNLEKHDIGALFYIGGNDSMDTVDKLSAYFAQVDCPIRVMGVPKTIDNDLMHTDHTPGYGSAAKFVATSMLEMIRDCSVYDLKSVLIVEIMGRDTGWLTAAAALPHLLGEEAPHLVYLPELPFSAEQFVADVKKVQEQHNTVIVAVSEGVELDNLGDFQSGKVDSFGHKYLSGIGRCLETLVQEKIGCKVRSVELNILQRCAAHIASEADLAESQGVGEAAVAAAARGETGKMAAMVRTDRPYAITYTTVPVSKVANQVKYVPRHYVNDVGNQITAAGLDYIYPLMMGDVTVATEHGLPKHYKVK